MDYAETGYRLLGVFRLWNAIEYYYPYRNILDEDWNDVLEESIEQVLADTDRHSYELTIASMAAKLHDAHTQFLDTGYLKEEFGEYTLPVNFILAEGQIVVKEVFDRSSLTSDKAAEDIPCQLQRGDVLLRINGEDIWEIIQKKEEYISVPQDDKIMNTMTSDLIRSKEPEITVTVLRHGQEITITDSGMEMVSINALTPPDQSHELLDGTIGLLNPAALSSSELPQIMEEFADTEGLIIDMRQYPMEFGLLEQFGDLFVDGRKKFVCLYGPLKGVPGGYTDITGNGCYIGNGNAAYQKPVVVLMDENSQSQSEWMIMGLRQGANVTVMGRNSVGADGNVTYLPLPDGNGVTFTGLCVLTPEGEQTQRIGLTPDIYVEPTVEGIRQGKDEILEAAVQFIAQ